MCDPECCTELAIMGYLPLGFIIIFLWAVFVCEPLIDGRYMFGHDENLAVVIAVFFPILSSVYCCGFGAILTCLTGGCCWKQRVGLLLFSLTSARRRKPHRGKSTPSVQIKLYSLHKDA